VHKIIQIKPKNSRELTMMLQEITGEILGFYKDTKEDGPSQ
jgi:hypothetical protein